MKSGFNRDYPTSRTLRVWAYSHFPKEDILSRLNLKSKAHSSSASFTLHYDFFKSTFAENFSLFSHNWGGLIFSFNLNQIVLNHSIF